MDKLVKRKSAIYLTIASLILLTSGCVDESVDGSVRTYTYELWVPLTILVGGLLAAIWGWFLRDTFGRYGWALLIGGPIAALFFAPSMFFDRAVVSDTSYSLRTGIWGMTATHEVEYEDLQLILVTSEEKRGRRGRRTTHYYLRCKRKDGTEAKVPLGNKISEAAAPYFLEQAAELGVPILNQT